MSTNTRLIAAIQARRARYVQKRLAAKLSGKSRGPDAADGSDRRVPQRNSYEENDSRAKPWSRVGDGSAGQGLAHQDALLQAATEQTHQDWLDNPARRAREARDQRAALAAELDELTAAGAAPIGRPAAIRIEIAKLDAIEDAYRARLRWIDVKILRALISGIDFVTGKLFPKIQTIANKAGCHRNSVIAGLRRLKAKGFIDWVRRTVRTGRVGEVGPQLEQTSNAYFFDHRRAMARRTWARFIQLLTIRLRRLGAVPAGVDGAPREVSDPFLRAALEGFGASIPNGST